MFCWSAISHWGFGSWWWVIPLIFMILCIAFCLSGMRRAGHGWCCGRRDRAGDLDELRKEIQELKKLTGSAG